jgi:hypothetical protein
MCYEIIEEDFDSSLIFIKDYQKETEMHDK